VVCTSSCSCTVGACWDQVEVGEGEERVVREAALCVLWCALHTWSSAVHKLHAGVTLESWAQSGNTPGSMACGVEGCWVLEGRLFCQQPSWCWFAW
jgi:hypothetical protein